MAIKLKNGSNALLISKIFQDNVIGLNFIMALKPVTFNFEYQKFSSFLGEKNADAELLKQKESKTEIGFVAQDIEATCKKLGITASNIVHTPDNDKDNYSIAYQELVVPLVKGMQEQQELIKAMQKELDAKNIALDSILKTNRSEIDRIKAELAEIKAMLKTNK